MIPAQVIAFERPVHHTQRPGEAFLFFFFSSWPREAVHLSRGATNEAKGSTNETRSAGRWWRCRTDPSRTTPLFVLKPRPLGPVSSCHLRRRFYTSFDATLLMYYTVAIDETSKRLEGPRTHTKALLTRRLALVVCGESGNKINYSKK